MGSTKTKTEKVKQEEVKNTITEVMVDEESKSVVVVPKDDGVDADKLAALKARAAKKLEEEKAPEAEPVESAVSEPVEDKKEEEAKEEDMPPRIVEDRNRSIRFGVIGSGAAGSRLSEQFYALGYPSVAINTAPQDLANIKLPEQNKLLLDFGLGGSAKDLSIGNDAADAYRSSINQLIHRHLDDTQVFIFCVSLGGGSGAGSVEVVVDLLAQFGKPVVVLTVLPKASEDAQLKHNAWQTLHKFTKMFNDGKVDNIITVDNAKIESLYSDVGPFNFFPVSNKAIVEPLHIFNTMSRRVDEGVKVLDSTEFGKLFIDGKGFTTYGTMTVEDYEDEMAIATAIVDSLKGNLLASGFDIRQARYAGFMLVAPERVWNKIPSASLHYAQHMIGDACESPLAVFHGVYKEESDDDCIKVYSMFSGLGLPEERIEQLKAEAKEKMSLAQKKDDERKMHMKVDIGEETVNKAEEIKRKIKQKSSSFNKLHGGAVKDRRKR